MGHGDARVLTEEALDGDLAPAAAVRAAAVGHVVHRNCGELGVGLAANKLLPLQHTVERTGNSPAHPAAQEHRKEAKERPGIWARFFPRDVVFVQLELLRPAATETAVVEAAAAALVDVVLLLRRDAGPKRLDDDGLDRLGHGVGYRAARRRLRSRGLLRSGAVGFCGPPGSPVG